MSEILKNIKTIIDNKSYSNNNYKKWHTKNVNKDVINYISDCLANAFLDISGKYQGYLLDLMKRDGLEGWCIQSTETAIVFFKDFDYIERGYLKLDDENQEYFHSWICFTYNNREYVFDPALNIISNKKDYKDYFKTKRIVKINAIDIKKAIMNKVDNSLTTEDIESPIYSNNCKYNLEMENGKIKKLIATFYH